MPDLALLYPLATTIAAGILLLLANIRTARREKLVPVPVRARRKQI